MSSNQVYMESNFTPLIITVIPCKVIALYKIEFNLPFFLFLFNIFFRIVDKNDQNFILKTAVKEGKVSRHKKCLRSVRLYCHNFVSLSSEESLVDILLSD